MRPDDIIGLLRARPFEPFRLHLSDGSHFDVGHPELAIVGRNRVVVGLPGKRGPKGPVERFVNGSLMHITRTEVLNGASKQ